MKLLVEAFPALPYKFKLIIADDDVRQLGSCWANELYTKMAEYASGYGIDEIIVYGPLDFSKGIAEQAQRSDVTNYVKKANITYKGVSSR